MIERKTAGYEAHLRLDDKAQRVRLLLRFSFWRRAQHMSDGYSDRFHLHVPPFVKNKMSRVYHIALTSSTQKFHIDQLYLGVLRIERRGSYV